MRDCRHELFTECACCSWLAQRGEAEQGLWTQFTEVLKQVHSWAEKCQCPNGFQSAKAMLVVITIDLDEQTPISLASSCTSRQCSQALKLFWCSFVYRGYKCSLFLISRVIMTKISIPQVSFHRLTDKFCWLLSHYESCSYFLFVDHLIQCQDNPNHAMFRYLIDCYGRTVHT